MAEIITIEMLADASLKVSNAEGVSVTIGHDQLLNAKELSETTLHALNRIDSDDMVGASANAIRQFLNDYNSSERNDIRRSSLPLTRSVNFIVEKQATGEINVSKIDDDQAMATAVGYNNVEFDIKTGEFLNKGIEHADCQPQAMRYTQAHSCVPLNDATYFKNGDKHRFALVNGSYVDANGVRHKSQVAITVGQTWLIEGVTINPNTDDASKRYELMHTMKSNGEEYTSALVVHFNGKIFKVRNVSLPMDNVTAATADALKTLSAMVSTIKAVNEAKMISSAMTIAGDGQFSGDDASEEDAAKYSKLHPLVHVIRANLNSLYALQWSQRMDDCNNTQRDIIDLTKGLESLQEWFMLMSTSNACASESSKILHLLGGQNDSWAESMYGTNMMGSAVTNMKYAAAASELASPSKIDTKVKLLYTFSALASTIKQASEVAVSDEYLAKYASSLRMNAIAIENAIRDLSASPARDAANSGSSVEVILPNDVQFLVGVNPNELFQYNLTYPGSDSTKQWQFDAMLKHAPHYKLYNYVESTKTIRYERPVTHGILPPALVAFLAFLENDGLVTRFMYNNGLGSKVGPTFAEVLKTTAYVTYNPNQFNYMNLLFGIAMIECEDKVGEYASAWRGFSALSKDLNEFGRTGDDFIGAIARIVNTIKDNAISSKRIGPADFVYNSKIANKIHQLYPIASFTGASLTKQGTVMGVSSRPEKTEFIIVCNPYPGDDHCISFDRFVPMNATLAGSYKGRDIASLESWIASMASSATKVYFGPGDDSDDIFASGANYATGDMSVLLYGSHNEPLLFKKTIADQLNNPRDVKLRFGGRTIAAPDAKDCAVYDNVQSELFEDDGFNLVQTPNAYVLVQIRPKDVTAGDKIRGRSHSTTAHNRYAFCPVYIKKMNNTDRKPMDYIETNDKNIKIYTKGVTASEREAMRLNTAGASANGIASHRYVFPIKSLSGYADGSKFREGIIDFGIPKSFKVVSANKAELETLGSAKYEFDVTDGASGCYTQAITYEYDETDATVASVYGYRRHVPMRSVIINDGGVLKQFAPAKKSYKQVDCVPIQPTLKETVFIRPYMYSNAELAAEYAPGVRTTVKAGTVKRPTIVSDAKLDSYDFKYNTEVFAVGNNGQPFGVACNDPADVAVAINCPLVMSDVFDDTNAPAATFANYEYDDVNESVLVRFAGRLVTPEDDQYWDHYCARYARGLKHPFAFPFVRFRSDDKVEVAWVLNVHGQFDYPVNRRLTNRLAIGRSYTVGYKNMIAELVRAHTNPKILTNFIYDAFHGTGHADDTASESEE